MNVDEMTIREFLEDVIDIPTEEDMTRLEYGDYPIRATLTNDGISGDLEYLVEVFDLDGEKHYFVVDHETEEVRGIDDEYERFEIIDILNAEYT